MKNTFSRRNFVQSGALIAAASVTSGRHPFIGAADAGSWKAVADPSWAGELYLPQLHPRTDDRLHEAAERQRVECEGCERPSSDGSGGGGEGAVRTMPRRASSFMLRERSIFRRTKTTTFAASSNIASVREFRSLLPATRRLRPLPRIEKFVKEYDIRLAIHNHGPEDKLWHSPLDVLKAVKKYDPRIGCCIDMGHTVRAGTDVVQGDPRGGTAAVQHAREGPDQLHEQGEPGCGG